MKNLIALFTLFLLVSCQSSKELNQLSVQMQNQIQQCNSCHSQGEKFGAPSLNGLELKYMNAQIDKYRKGLRGGENASKDAISMREAIVNLNDKDLKEINAWFASQESKKAPSDTVHQGNGEALYKQHCYGCHQGTMGKFFTGSPSILELESWYIVKQCGDFQAGRRGASPEDEKGYKMAQRIKNLSPYEIQEIADFLAN